ncbi:MAG: hypothetical protein ACR2L6_06760 [Gemmatimonadaceae bacterium]
MSSDCGTARRVLLDRSAVRRLDERRLSAERHAGQCPRCRSFISESEAGAALLKASLSVPPPDAVRERLFEAVAAARTGAPAARWLPYLAAAVTAAAIGGLLLGYNLTSRPGYGTVIASIVSDHAIAASDDRIESGDAVEIEAWLAARVAHAVMVPALAGGRVVGARICVTPQGRGAVVEYEIDGRRVSYFILVAPSEGRTDEVVRVAGIKGYSIAHWRDRGLIRAFVGALPAARIKELAQECIHLAQSRRAARYFTRETSRST